MKTEIGQINWMKVQKILLTIRKKLNRDEKLSLIQNIKLEDK